MVVDVPEDVCHGTLPFDEDEFAVDARYEAAPALRCRPAADDIERAAKLLADAKRPLMLCGGGVHISQAADDVSAFARAQNIPVAHTMTGKGAIACTDPLSAGLFGRYDRIANALIDESDVLLVVGCKLGEIATKRFTVPPKGKTVIHLDIVAEEIGRTYQPDDRAVGRRARGRPRSDGGAGGRRHADSRQARRTMPPSVGKRMAAWQAGVTERLTSNETPINVARMMNELNGVMPADGILRRRRRFCRALGGAALRHQAGRPRLRARPRLRLDRLRPARRHRRGAGGQGARRSCRSPATAAST